LNDLAPNLMHSTTECGYFATCETWVLTVS
jgi:hypothetical protein